MDGAKLVLTQDGKPNPKTKKRDIHLRVNGAAFNEICGTINAILPYNDGRTKSNLSIKVNCRPYQCNNITPLATIPSVLENTVQDVAVANMKPRNATSAPDSAETATNLGIEQKILIVQNIWRKQPRK